MTLNLTFVKAALVVVALLLGTSIAVYVHDVQPQTFKKGDEVPLKVNWMTSFHTQIPKDYYQLPYCVPEGGLKNNASENLREILTGNKIQSSPYSIHMLNEVYCQKLCQIQLQQEEANRLRLWITQGYHNNWIIDNIPSAALGLTAYGHEQRHYAGGFPVGFVAQDTKEAYIYNHVNIHLQFHKPEPDEDGYRVVGFAVDPMSIQHRFQGNYEWDGNSTEGFYKALESCPNPGIHMNRNLIRANQIVKVGETILYTYDVIWTESPVAWSSRWDIYLSEGNLVPAQVHWNYTVRSILVPLFLSLFMVAILGSRLKRNIAAYDADEENDINIDESGWKTVHADVFRPPSSYPMVYCVFVGTGVQLFTTSLLVLLFAAIGFLSQACRGSLKLAVFVFYMLSGVFAGYVSSRLYKAFQGTQRHLCSLLTATLFPGCAFVLFLVLFFVTSPGSTAPIVILIATWCCVLIPLVFLGAYFGYEENVIAYPTITSTVALDIPPPPLYLHPLVGMTVTGIVPFAAAYEKIFFIMTSLWFHQFYNIFGLTLIVYLILLITCAEATVLLVYYQLSAQNHRWWWYSFFTAGSTALYAFIYSLYWFQKLEVTMAVTYLLYFGYMFLICFAVMLVTGMVGALTSLWFVRKIFYMIKREEMAK